MNKSQFMKILKQWDKMNRYVFTKHDLAKLFPKDSPKTLTESLSRFVKEGFIERACRGIYVNQEANSLGSYVIEQIAKTLRAGHYNYVSLESMLAEYGAISQAPVDRLTVMTTGRSGIHKTTYGVIEFTHTKRSITDILQHTITVDQRPLRLATVTTAWRDLKRVGRNIHLVNTKEISYD